VTDKDDDILEEAKERFEGCEDYYSSEYKRGDEDTSFAMGNQWPDEIKTKRDKDNRPTLTENRLQPFIDQVVNAAREMRPAIRVSPIDDKGDNDTAEIFKGVIRNIERQSKASAAYDTGMQNSTTSGYGWIRINTDYCDPLSFDQEIKIDRVLNWKSVMLDPNSLERDGSDAEYGFIYDDVPVDLFEEQFPDASHTSLADDAIEWFNAETVRVVEYYYKSYETKTIVRMNNGDVVPKDAAEDMMEHFPELNLEIIEERETEIPTVKWAKITGEEILEETDWLGQYIPLVPVFGKEIWEDGRRKSYSLIHQAKDPQRMFNFWRSASTEMIALQPKAPWVGVVGQFNTFGNKWATANTENYPYLEFDMVNDPNSGMPAPPPQRQMPIQPNAGMLQEAALAAEGISATLGMYEEGRGMQSNAISGIAIEARSLRGDKATFHFLDNLACAIRHVGVILVDLIPKIYDEAKIVRILGEDGQAETVPVNQPYMNAEGGAKVPMQGNTGQQFDGFYDLQAGKYDVDVDVGKSYANKQQEFISTMSELAKVDPRLLEVSADKIVRATGAPEADEIADRIASMMDPAMLGDDPQAQKLQAASQQIQQMQERVETLHAALQDKEKNAEQEFMLEAGKLEDDKKNTEIKLMKTMAEIEKMKAETQGMNSEQMQDIATAIMQLRTEVDDIGEATAIQLEAEERRQAETMEGLAPEINLEQGLPDNE